MAEENEKQKKPLQPITDEYKMLQELKQVLEAIKATNAKLDLVLSDIQRNRGV